MQCWKILELPSNADLKSIKKSYAKKLKDTKPDEDPEGFQRLYGAYKEALKIAKQPNKRPLPELAHADTVSSFDNIEHLSSTFDSEPSAEALAPSLQVEDNNLSSTFLEYPPTQESTETTEDEPTLIERLNEYGQENQEKEMLEIVKESISQQPVSCEQLLLQALNLLKDVETINNMPQWQDVLSQSLHLDLSKKDEFIQALFEAVVSHLKLNIPPKFDVKTLKYLDDVLAWSQRFERFEPAIDDIDIQVYRNALLSRKERLKYKYLSPKQHQGSIINGDRFIRFFAFAIDMSLLLLLISIGESVNDAVPEAHQLSFSHAVWLIFAWLFFAFPILESTALQGSFGKLVFGIKVVNKDGKRLNVFHSFWRFVVFIVLMIGLKFTFWINIFLKDNVLIQDIGSSTRVIKR